MLTAVLCLVDIIKDNEALAGSENRGQTQTDTHNRIIGVPFRAPAFSVWNAASCFRSWGNMAKSFLYLCKSTFTLPSAFQEDSVVNVSPSQRICLNFMTTDLHMRSFLKKKNSNIFIGINVDEEPVSTQILIFIKEFQAVVLSGRQSGASAWVSPFDSRVRSLLSWHAYFLRALSTCFLFL